MVYYICSGFIFLLSFSLVHLETIVFGADLYDVFKNSKILKNFFIYFNARSSRCVGQYVWNFAWWSVVGLNYNTGPKFRGGALQKDFRGQKHAKFGSILDDLELCRRMSPEWMKMFRIRQEHDRLRFLPRSAKKSDKLSSSDYEDFGVESYPSKSAFSENYFSPWGCCTPKFLHVLESDQVLSAHPHRGWQSPLQFFFKGGLIVELQQNYLLLLLLRYSDICITSKLVSKWLLLFISVLILWTS